MHSTRIFVRLWLCITVVILAYAFLDLSINPWLREEHAFTMQPDLTKVPDLVHWGGRLLKERAVSLLIANAIVLGGLVSIGVSAVVGLLRRTGEAEQLNARTSMPPS